MVLPQPRPKNVSPVSYLMINWDPEGMKDTCNTSRFHCRHVASERNRQSSSLHPSSHLQLPPQYIPAQMLSGISIILGQCLPSCESCTTMKWMFHPIISLPLAYLCVRLSDWKAHCIANGAVNPMKGWVMGGIYWRMIVCSSHFTSW